MIFLTSSAADLRLSVAGLDANRRPTLLLSGLGSGQYAIEASTNLTRWFNLTTAPGANGELRFLHNEASSFRAIYYRGVKVPGDVGPLTPIVPQLDSNQVAVAVVTFQEGGSLSLTNEAGVRYTFTVAPSNVLQSAAITMQLVTNLVSFPFENELRTAVKFTPEGFRFHGAGLLEIQFPTNVPHLKLSSFAFDGAGGDFHLMPDRVATNRVRIPVTHFSVFGTAVWGPTERTRAFETRVSNVESAGQHRSAEILGRERQLQLLGASDGGDEALAEVNQITQDYYDRELKPQFTAAESDCSLFQSLMPRVLGVERQQQLLGASEGVSFISSETFDKARCNCLDELIAACEEASISAESFMQGLLGLERQAQLLGGSLEACGPQGNINEWMADAQNNRLPCLTEWVGTLSYSEAGSFSGQSSSTSVISGTQPQTVMTTVLESMSVQYEFRGGVERVELEDDSIPGLFSSLTWDLSFYPDATGAYAYKLDTRKSYECRNDGGVKQEDTIHDVRGGGSGSNEVRVHFVFEDGELTAFTILQRESLKLKIPTHSTNTRTDCPRRDPNTGELREQAPKTIFAVLGETTRSFPVNYVPTEQVVFSKKSPTELMGTVSGNRQEFFGQALVNIPYRWEFSLRRRQQ